MASGIITLTSTRSTLEGRIVWNSTSNGSEKNTSNVTASLQVRRNDSYSTKGTWTGNLQIDNKNETFSLSSTSVNNDWVTMKEFTVEGKNHNSDGSGNCYIYGKVNGPAGTSMSGYYVEGSENVTLDKIPRYAVIGNFRIVSYTINTAQVGFGTDSAIDAWQWWIKNVSSTWSDFEAENIIHNLTPGTNYSIKMRVKRTDSQLWTETDYINFSTYSKASFTTANSFNIGTNPTVTFENPSSCKIVIYSENIVNGTVESKLTQETDVTGQKSYTFNLNANTLYAKVPNSNSGIIRYNIRSTNDGKDYYTSKDVNYYVTNSNPTFSNWTYADVNSKTLELTEDNQKIINGYSTVKATISAGNKATAKNYASMKKYRLIIGNSKDEANYSTSDISMQISNASNATMTVYAIDSRGNSTPKTVSSDFINYTNAYIKSIAVERQQSGISSEVKLTYSGYIWNGNFGAKQNSITTVKYYYRQSGTSEWKTGTTELSPTVSGNSFSQSVLIAGDLAGEGFNINNSYEIKMAVSDELTVLKETTPVVLGSGTPLVAYAKNGVAINGFYNNDEIGPFQVNGQMTIMKDSGDVLLRAKRTDTKTEARFGIGSGGTNHGIWSTSLNKWMIYSNGTNVYLPAKTVANDTFRAKSLNSQYMGTINGANWIYMGEFELSSQSQYAVIECYTGNGQNGYDYQNTHLTILLKKGWSGADSPIGITAKFTQNYSSLIRVGIVYTNTEKTKCALYVYLPFSYNDLTYFVNGSYDSYTAKNAGVTEPTFDKEATYYYDGPISLFTSTSGSNGTINLSQTSANFSMLKIIFKDEDGCYNSVDVASPDTKTVILFTTVPDSYAWIKSRSVSISGKSISTKSYINAATTQDTSNTTKCEIYITNVFGYL